MSSITSAPFGKTHEGDPVEIYTLRNNRGMETRIMTYGGAVVSLTAPDRKGKYDEQKGCDDDEQGQLGINE